MPSSHTTDLSHRIAVLLLELLASQRAGPPALTTLIEQVEALADVEIAVALVNPAVTAHSRRLPALPQALVDALASSAGSLAAPAGAARLLPIVTRQQHAGWLWLCAAHPVTAGAVLPPLLHALQVIADGTAYTARMQRLLQNQAEFVRMVTHDLRSPLTSVHGFAAMLESQEIGPLNARQQHYIDQVVRGTTQLAALIHNIADAGRYDPDTGFYDMMRSAVDPNEMIERLVEAYLIPPEKARLRVAVRTCDDAPLLNVDEHMMERAIVNLVDNAIKYTPDGGEVTVGVEVAGGRLCVFVRDTGGGISAEEQQCLFQRHVRLKRPEHRMVRGLGLGLFIVRSAAQHHGGDAYVISELGKGSTFGIWLPLNEENVLAEP